MSNMVEFAKNELRLLRSGNEPDEMQDMMDAHIVGMVEKFADQGHSGFSASYAVGILEKVLRFEPVTPLTGEDDEWTALDYGDDMAAQNKRCSHVFKRKDGTAYDIEAVIFENADGSRFTSKGSRRNITFPYRPTREYVKVA